MKRRNKPFSAIAAAIAALAITSLVAQIQAYAQTYLVTEIVPLPGHTTSVATGVNSSGAVVGYSYLSGADPNNYAAIRGFRWVGGVTSPFALLSGKDGNVATGVNSFGEACGYAFNISGSSFINLRGFIDLPTDHYGYSAGPHDVGHLGGGESSAYGINDLGNVVGEALTADGYSHAFVWITSALASYATPGIWDIGSLGGAFGTSAANAINNVNQITGGSTTDAGDYQAFLWCPSASTPFLAGLNNLGALATGADSVGSGLNDAGQVVGYSYTSATGSVFKATLFDHGKLTAYSPLSGGSFSGANKINSYGQITGNSDHAASATEGTRAIIISGGIQYDLNTLLGSGTGWLLEDALAIGENGQIVGYGSHLQPDSTIPTRAYVLTPNYTLAANTGIPSSINAGASVSTAAVNLDKAVGMAVVVKLSSNNTGVRVPASVTVPAGATSKSFTITVDAGAAGPAAITATLYSASRVSNTTVNPPGTTATSLTVPSVSGSPNATVTLKATLTVGGSGLKGKTIAFKVDGTAIGSGTTNSYGIASLSHVLTEAGGDHVLAASFAGDSAYGASSGTGTLTIKLPSTTITLVNVSGNPGATVTLKATLKSGATLLSGRTVTLKVDGTPVGSPLTDAFGVATVSHTLTETGGAHVLTAEFAGDTSYAPSLATGTLTVKRISTTVTITSVTGAPGSTVTFKAKLKSGTLLLTGETVTFLVDGSAVGTAQTDSLGVAQVAHKITESVGTHELRSHFDGDATYDVSTSPAGTLTVVKMNSTTTVTSVSAKIGANATLKATVKAGSTPVVGAAVTFKVAGADVGTGTTDTTGLATLAYKVTQDAGAYALAAEFAGNDGYNASSGAGTLTALQATTKTTADATKAPAGTSVSYGAKLVRTTDSALLAGKTLNFYDGATYLGSAVTNTSGRATISLTAPAKGVKKLITVKFPGDPSYAASSATGSITGT